MAKNNKNWTPKEIRSKSAEKWQGIFYGGGLLSGLISWGNFSNNNNDIGLKFALVAIAAFGVGSLIKTTWLKRAQVDMYMKDKKREALRYKFYGAGIICGVITALVLNNGAQEAGGFFAIGSAGALLIGGIIPVKWVKRHEVSGYR